MTPRAERHLRRRHPPPPPPSWLRPEEEAVATGCLQMAWLTGGRGSSDAPRARARSHSNREAPARQQLAPRLCRPQSPRFHAGTRKSEHSLLGNVVSAGISGGPKVVEAGRAKGAVLHVGANECSLPF